MHCLLITRVSVSIMLLLNQGVVVNWQLLVLVNYINTTFFHIFFQTKEHFIIVYLVRKSTILMIALYSVFRMSFAVLHIFLYSSEKKILLEAVLHIFPNDVHRPRYSTRRDRCDFRQVLSYASVTFDDWSSGTGPGAGSDPGHFDNTPVRDE